MKQSETVLITGASGGIGEELAKLFAKNGYGLVLVARNNGELERVAKALRADSDVSVETVALDLTLPDAPVTLWGQLDARSTQIDVLVNNAGFGQLGDVAEAGLESAMGQIELNVIALTALTRLFLPGMIQRRRGKILNVGSTAGFQPGPHMAVYYATKAYVLSFSEAVAAEVRDQGVTVTCLCPGPTATGFQRRAALTDAPIFRWRRPMSAEAVALEGYRALHNGKVLVITGLQNRLLAESIRFAPRRLVTSLSGRLLERRA